MWHGYEGLGIGGGKNMWKLLTFLVALSMTISLAARVYALGGDHPADQQVNLDNAPPGLNDLINQKTRVHGYFVNAQDWFFFGGDTAAFAAFLKQYARLDGIAGHRLVVHRGKGQAKSPWDKGEGKPCGWMLDVGLISWAEGHGREVYKDPKTAESKTEKPKYMAELHVWEDGNVNLEKVTIPDTVNVVREAQAEAKEKGTAKQGTLSDKK